MTIRGAGDDLGRHTACELSCRPAPCTGKQGSFNAARSHLRNGIGVLGCLDVSSSGWGMG